MVARGLVRRSHKCFDEHVNFQALRAYLLIGHTSFRSFVKAQACFIRLCVKARLGLLPVLVW